MKKKKRNKIFNSLFSFLTVSRKDLASYGLFLIIMVLFVSLGYAAFGQQIDILNSVAIMRSDRLYRISGVSFNVPESSLDADSIQDYNIDNIGLTVDLPSANSYAVYDVQIKNRDFRNIGLYEITNLPNNIDYEILNYSLGNSLCDANGNCNAGDLNCSGSGCTPYVTSTVKVKFFYKDGMYDPNNITQNIVAFFDLRYMHSITYNAFDNISSYPKEVIDGGTVSVTFNQRINSVSILMNGIPLAQSEYTFNNNVLTIPNVVGDLEIINLSFYTITFDNMGGINGPSVQHVAYDDIAQNVSIPTRAGYSFEGYWSNFDVTGLDYYTTNHGSTIRINLFDDLNWRFTTEDIGRFFQIQFVLTDNTKTSPPTGVEFNDYRINPEYYNIVQTGDHTWTYTIALHLTDHMIELRSIYDYIKDYRFVDVEGVSSTATASVNYVYLDDGIYFDKYGSSLILGGLNNDVTVYAKWIDNIPPLLTYTATYDVNSGGTYTQGSWTNKKIYTNFTVVEKGSGLDSNLVQYSLDGGTTWNTFSFVDKALSVSDGVYTGTEHWTLPLNGIRTGDVIFKACDNVGQCDTKEYHFKYDTALPIISSATWGYPTADTVQLVISANDGAGSGIDSVKFGLSSSSSCSGVTWGSSNTFSNANVEYVCVKVLDKAGNATINAYPAEYNVTAYLNDGTLSNANGWNGTGNSLSKTLVFNSTYEPLPVVSKSGYDFKGWTYDDNYIILDSITTDGYEYIDTGFVDPNGMRAEYKAIFLDTTGGYIVGSHNYGSPYGRNGVYWSLRTQWEMGYGEICPGLGYGDVNIPYEVDFKTTYNDAYIRVKEAGSNEYIVNSTYSGQTISSFNVYLFFNQYSEQFGGESTRATVYYVKIYDSNGNLVRDYVPAKRASDGILGMYDKLNGVFYTTKRAGLFIPGEETETLINTSGNIRKSNHSIYAVYEDNANPTISSVSISYNSGYAINIVASDTSGIADYAYALNSSDSCSSSLEYTRVSNSFNLSQMNNNYLCIRVRDNVGNTSYNATPVPYSVVFSDPSAGNIPGIASSNSSSITLPSTIPTRANSEFIGWSTTSGATTPMYTAGQTITLSSRVTTLYAVWKTYTWKVYNIAYTPYDTGYTWDWKWGDTEFYVTNSFTNNNDGTVTLNMNTRIYWSLLGNNQATAAGQWMGTGRSKSSTETTDCFYYINKAVYWVPQFTVSLTTWKVKTDPGSDTGQVVTSTYNNSYPSRGDSGGKYYVLQ